MNHQAISYFWGVEVVGNRKGVIVSFDGERERERKRGDKRDLDLVAYGFQPSGGRERSWILISASSYE